MSKQIDDESEEVAKYNKYWKEALVDPNFLARIAIFAFLTTITLIRAGGLSSGENSPVNWTQMKITSLSEFYLTAGFSISLAPNILYLIFYWLNRFSIEKGILKDNNKLVNFSRFKNMFYWTVLFTTVIFGFFEIIETFIKVNQLVVPTTLQYAFAFCYIILVSILGVVELKKTVIGNDKWSKFRRIYHKGWGIFLLLLSTVLLVLFVMKLIE